MLQCSTAFTFFVPSTGKHHSAQNTDGGVCSGHETTIAFNPPHLSALVSPSQFRHGGQHSHKRNVENPRRKSSKTSAEVVQGVQVWYAVLTGNAERERR